VKETDVESFFKAVPSQLVGQENASARSSAKKKKKAGWNAKLPADQRGKVSGPFETFLKVEAESDEEEVDDDPRNPLDFNSFLKTALTKAPAASKAPVSEASAAPDTGSAGPKPEHARVLVMFGTEYGFSKEIAQKLCAKLQATDKYWPVLVDMADAPSGWDLANEQALIIACSTQGDGVPPTEAREFCDWLTGGKAGRLDHLAFSVCALGDRSYQHFCRCGKQLDGALEAAGAVQLAAREDVNKEDWAAVDLWMARVVDGLSKRQLKPIGQGAAAATVTAAPAGHGKKWGKSRPYWARVVAVEGLCTVKDAADKNTFRVEFDTAGAGEGGLAYAPGDALGVYPRNGDAYVEELLRVMGADGGAQVPTPSWHYAGPAPEGGVSPAIPTTLPLREALAACYDLRVPKAELFSALLGALPEDARTAAAFNSPAKPPASPRTPGANGAHSNGAPKAMTPAEQAAELRVLVQGGSEAAEAYFAAGRHVVDVLRHFSAARPTVAQLLAALRQLQPRLYSISSSPLEDAGRVQATIAEVKYDFEGAERIGVCSTYVSERIQVGDTVPVYIHKNPDFRLPAAPATPIVMVGPGTGLAPFRAFIAHRLLEGKAQAAAREAAAAAADAEAGRKHKSLEDGKYHGGEMVLFFGCRRKDQDFLYGKQLTKWAKDKVLTLHTAFSREQTAKVYVQDRLRGAADAVWALLHDQGGHFYVCGDASSMAGAVEAALLQIIGARLSPEEAAALRAQAAAKAAPGTQPAEPAQVYLDNLSATGRYQRDVWY